MHTDYLSFASRCHTRARRAAVGIGAGGLGRSPRRVPARGPPPPYGVGVVVANPPVSEALFPVRRQEGGGNTRVAMHNLESTTALLRCGLMREGVLREAGPEPVEFAYDEAVELYEG